MKPLYFYSFLWAFSSSFFCCSCLWHEKLVLSFNLSCNVFDHTHVHSRFSAHDRFIRLVRSKVCLIHNYNQTSTPTISSNQTLSFSSRQKMWTDSWIRWKKKKKKKKSSHLCRIRKWKEFDLMEWSRQERIFGQPFLISIRIRMVEVFNKDWWPVSAKSDVNTLL